MAFFSKNDGGLMDVIRCDEQDYLIWKWHPQGSGADDARANAIRWGSSLRVKQGSVAAFVYTQEDGTPQEFIEGPYDGIIDTKNFPVIANIVGAAYNGDTPFQAEVYFINLAQMIQLKFGVPYFDVFDPRFTDFGVPTAVRGSITFKISDYREFIKLHRLENFDMNDFRGQIRDVINRIVKSVVANAPSDYGIPLMQIERKIREINEIVEVRLASELELDFGVKVTRVDIAEIDISKDSEEYKKVQSLTQNKAAVFTQAVANIGDTVGTHMIGAKRIKQAARNDGLPIEESSLSVAAKKAASGIMGAISNIGKKRVTPPPIPNAGYYVALAGQQAGPFKMEELSKMAAEGALSTETLVWKDGMKEWEAAGTIKDLESLFN